MIGGLDVTAVLGTSAKVSSVGPTWASVFRLVHHDLHAVDAPSCAECAGEQFARVVVMTGHGPQHQGGLSTLPPIMPRSVRRSSVVS